MTDAAAKPAFPAMSIEQAHALLTQPGTLLETGEAEVRGVKMKVWKAAPPTLHAIFALSAAFGPRDHLVFEDERATINGLRAAAAALARQLIADGVKPGDRVAIIMRNVPEWPVAFWAGVLAGAIVTPLNAWWTGAELEYGICDSGSSVLIVDHERYERIREHLPNCPSVKKIYVSRMPEESADPALARLESVIGGTNDWAGLTPPAGLEDFPQRGPDDDVTIFYTSGTTGHPKGAVISHRNIISNIWNGASAQARAFLRRGEAPPQPDPSLPQKSFLISVPFFHATGCFAVMIPSLMRGDKLVMQRKFDAGQALQLFEKERVTHFGGVPTIAWQVLEHPDVDKYDLSSIEGVAYGGAPAAPELVKRIKARWPGSSPSQGWGMTETAATAVSNVAEDYERKPSSTGVPAPTGEAKIIGENGQELARGEVGELWYKGPIVVRGYWNKPEATAETFIDGWIKTGDLAKMDEEGFIYIVDRAKDMLIRGGENIYCVEVENAIYEHPAIMDAAVIGKPHQTLGEEPIAVVHLKPGMNVSSEALRHHVAQKLAAFKVPVEVIFWPTTLPRNANGKIVKKELKKQIEQPQF
ncbi:MAG TPA: class I adenylate-forming enzyme family protein [Vitreimonas sp.]|uniref:class I adenylate-forming enzyme family protein n=1 Tax=Vitreimonas sp. TaxID=3069702 RepID=UPI002D577949|nr:class I adenylate-forming enzyme family protein [Vitreimonas sp.]HYD89318.1 class I adenylate-forming enzyme family protein [Vitreimonas sp.]